MAPFSRFIASWSVLLLILACAHENGVIQLVHSNLAVGNNIEIGQRITEGTAIAKLSIGENQQAWWDLANVPWHDSAVQRFFAAGPLQAAEMRQLAKADGNYSGTWHASNIRNVSGEKDIMQALQNQSTHKYQMSRSFSGTGKIHASMWTLLFRCVGITSCNQGYFTPVVAIQSENGSYTYCTLWLRPTTNLVVNTTPFSLGKLPKVNVTNMDADDPEGLSISANVHDSVPFCNFTATEVYRSLLDASYGLVPGSACIKFGTDGPSSFKLLVSPALSATDDQYSSQWLSDHEDFFRKWLEVNRSQWEYLPFEECSEEVVLIRFCENLYAD